MQLSGLNNHMVRQHNRRTIMSLVWRYKRLSKSQLYPAHRALYSGGKQDPG